MARRYRKKKIKMRGKRTHGGGNVKNRRGAGNRGGKGRAGIWKHRFSSLTAAGIEIGKRGFSREKIKKDVRTINVGEIERYALAGELKKENNMYVFDFNGKVLGGGQLTLPILVRAKSFSKKAEKKLADVGGKAEVLKEKDKEKTE
ncbi:MAG: uL15 family ribosomal protein [Candidatus Anstonellales archaeon]